MGGAKARFPEGNHRRVQSTVVAKADLRKMEGQGAISQPRTIRGESVRAINANVAVLLLISEGHLPVC
jgi:hypothetical protein